MANTTGSLPSLENLKAQAARIGANSAPSFDGSVEQRLTPVTNLVPVGGAGGKESFLSRVVHNAEDIATGLVPGFVATVKAPALDIAGLFKGDADFNRTRDLVTAVGKGMVEDLKHPLRNPINTVLTIGSVLSFGAGTAARAAAAAKALEASGTAADIARAAAFGPRASELRRVVKVEGKAPVQSGSYSRSALTRSIQRGVDALREAYPERRFPVRTQEQRYGRALAKNEYINPQRIERAAANEIQFLFKRLTGPEVRAIQLYAENVPVEIRSKLHQKVLDAARIAGDKVIARKNERILQLDAVANIRYVKSSFDDAGNLTGVEWRPGKQSEKLKNIFDRTNEIVKQREDDLVQAGLRSRAGLESRKQAVPAVYTGAVLHTAKDDAELKAEAEKAIAANDEKIGKLQNDLTFFLQKNLRKPEAAVATAKRKAGALVSGGGVANAELRAKQAELSVLKQKYKKADAAREGLAAKIPLFYLVDSVLNGAENVSPIEKADVGKFSKRRAELEAQRGEALRAISEFGDQDKKLVAEKLSIIKKIDKKIELFDTEKTKAQQSNLAELTDWRNLHQNLSEAVDTHNQLIEVLHGLHTEISFVEDAIRAARQSNKDVARKIVNNAISNLEKAKEEHRAIVGARVLALKALRDNNSALVARIDESARNVGKFIGGSGDFAARMYTPQGYDQALRSVFRIAGIGPKGIVGMPKRPRWLTNPYTGSATRRGTNRLDLGNALAERIHEGVRFIYLLKFRNALLSMASDTPKGIKDPVAIRLTSKPVKGLEQVFAKVQDNIKLSRDERDMLGQAFGDFQKELFDENLGKQINIDEWKPDPNIKWISKDMLGGLNLPSPMATLDKGGVKVALKRVDDLNNLTKFVTLYLRPATVVPNVLGNTALMLVQQGFFAPINMTNAVKLIWGMSPKAKMILDQFIGEGRMAQLSAEGGVGAGLLSRGARFFGKFQDLPFRRAAFLHEARREGYRTSRDVERLLTDPELRDTLYAVSDRANKAMIDYQDLNNFEKSVLRRVFYFYPWVKGATKYTMQFPFESPGTSAVGAQVANIASEEERKKFGDIPFWARGLIQVGERNGLPLTVQTQNILPFTTGVQSLQALTGLFGTGSGPSPILGNLSPATQATLQALTGRTTLGYPVPKGQMPIETFGRSIAESTPLGSAVKKAIEGTNGGTYPASIQDLILQYLVSQTFAPRPTDVGRLQSIKASESSQ